MISDVQYNEWLFDDNAELVVLVEAEHSAGVVHVANAVFISGANDTPAHTSYLDVLTGDIDINSRIDTATKSFGSIELINDGELTPWLDLFWRGYPLRLFIGDASWARDDFRLIFDGINGGINSPDADSLEWSIYDHSEKLNKNIGSETNLIAFGQLFNIEPVLVDSQALKYKVNTGAVESISVRDNGVVISPTIDLTNGEFTLTEQSAGRITADVVQKDKSATAIVKAICALIDVEVDVDNLTSFTNSAALGYYIKASTSAASIINEILNSVGATALFNDIGQLQVYRLEAPATPTLYITHDDIKQDGMKLSGIEQPVSKITLGYRRNWAVQDQASLASSLNAQQAKTFNDDYQTVERENTILNHPLAEERRVNTVMASQADCDAECQRRAVLRSMRRRIWSLECFLSASQVRMGQTINVTYPDYGFVSGKDVVVIGINRSINNRELELILWR